MKVYIGNLIDIEVSINLLQQIMKQQKDLCTIVDKTN